MASLEADRVSSPDFLNHRTVETGDVRRSPRAEVEPDVLEARLWAAGQALEVPPAVRMRVEIRPGLAPMLTAAMADVVWAPNPARASLEAGNLERCVAWTWLASREG